MQNDSGAALIDPHKVFERIALASGMRVADFGCGRTGHFVFPASRVVGEKGIVYAVEIVKNILESIKSRAKSEGYLNVLPVWSNIELVGQTPIPADSLDVCFLVNVLYMVGDKLATFQEAARLVRKDGFVTVVEWTKKLGTLGPAEELMVKPDTIINLAEQAGLASKENFSAGDYHYCLIFNKK